MSEPNSALNQIIKHTKNEHIALLEHAVRQACTIDFLTFLTSEADIFWKDAIGSEYGKNSYESIPGVPIEEKSGFYLLQVLMQ